MGNLLFSINLLNIEKDNYELSTKELKELNSRVLKIESKLLKALPVLDIYNGPLVEGVQIVMKRHNIVQQSYHSRSFIGNHCSKYIKPCVQNDISTSILEKVCELSSSSQIYKEAKVISNKFQTLNSLYSAVHDKIGHMNHISDDEELNEVIQNYLTCFRKYFPLSTIPKMHFLEDHASQWIRKWGFGMALHGEQGGEGIHREFNRLERNMAHVKKDENKLLYMMKEHHTFVHPAIQTGIIQIKKKKCSKEMEVENIATSI